MAPFSRVGASVKPGAIQHDVAPLVQVRLVAAVDCLHALAAYEEESQPYFGDRSESFYKLLSTLSGVEGGVEVIKLVDDDEVLVLGLGCH